MNTDYLIQIKTKHGRTTSYRKEDNGWSQTAPTGIVRQLSGDQLLSHLLPPLAGDQPGLRFMVERKQRTKKTPNAQHPTPNGENRRKKRLHRERS